MTEITSFNQNEQEEMEQHFALASLKNPSTVEGVLEGQRDPSLPDYVPKEAKIVEAKAVYSAIPTTGQQVKYVGVEPLKAPMGKPAGEQSDSSEKE